MNIKCFKTSSKVVKGNFSNKTSDNNLLTSGAGVPGSPGGPGGPGGPLIDSPAGPYRAKLNKS